MPKIINRPTEVTVTNLRITSRNSKIPNKFTGKLEYVNNEFRVYPYKSKPEIVLYFDKTGEFYHQNMKKEESDLSVEWKMKLEF